MKNLQDVYQECVDFLCGKSTKDAKAILEEAVIVLDNSPLSYKIKRFRTILNGWTSSNAEDLMHQCEFGIEHLRDDLEVFLNGNKYPYQIIYDYDNLKQSVRLYFSRMLMDYDENNRLDCFYPIFRNREYFGLGELAMPYVDKMYQMNDGTIWIHIYGNDEDSWSELDEFDTDDLIDFIQQIENNN